MNKFNNIFTLSGFENMIEDGGLRTKKDSRITSDFKPFFTIITVVKNSPKSIEKTIKSVLSQKIDNFEYIIIDGNSSDDTLKKIKEHNNNLNYWCCINDEGIYDAMNYGLKLAKGNIIGIINAGDIYASNALSIVNDYFKKNEDLSFLFGTVERHYLENNTIVKTGFNRQRIKYNFDSQTCHSSGFFINSKTQKQIGLYDLRYKCSSDYDLFYKLLTNDKFNGVSTKKDELIGVVESGGFSSKYGYWKHLIEETKIRINNKQGKLFILMIFINSIIKGCIKKLFKK
jgi:glycosyltransferase involved in cell wall biosynthesis|tara:strand:- start:278 stop:1135 length:858 start_codon:yes stop_codon:yes gene_type:complete